jgi:hypothetical protein
VAGVPPKVTLFSSSKSEPSIVTAVPPAFGPEAGYAEASADAWRRVLDYLERAPPAPPESLSSTPGIMRRVEVGYNSTSCS